MPGSPTHLLLESIGDPDTMRPCLLSLLAVRLKCFQGHISTQNQCKINATQGYSIDPEDDDDDDDYDDDDDDGDGDDGDGDDDGQQKAQSLFVSTH